MRHCLPAGEMGKCPLCPVNFMAGKSCIIKLLMITKGKGWAEGSVGNLSSDPQHSGESWRRQYASAVLAQGRNILQPSLLVHQPGGMNGWVPCWIKNVVSKKRWNVIEGVTCQTSVSGLHMYAHVYNPYTYFNTWVWAYTHTHTQ